MRQYLPVNLTFPPTSKLHQYCSKLYELDRHFIRFYMTYPHVVFPPFSVSHRAIVFIWNELEEPYQSIINSSRKIKFFIIIGVEIYTELKHKHRWILNYISNVHYNGKNKKKNNKTRVNHPHQFAYVYDIICGIRISKWNNSEHLRLRSTVREYRDTSYHTV